MRAILWASCVTFVVAICHNVEAGVMHYEFSGSDGVILDPDNLVGGSRSGLSFTGSFDLDSTTVSSASTFNVGAGRTVTNYTFNPGFAPNGLSILIDGLNVVSSQSSTLTASVRNDLPSVTSPIDGLAIYSTPFLDVFPVSLGSSSSLSLSLLAASGDVFANTDLIQVLSISEMTFSTHWRAQFRDVNNNNRILFEVFGNVSQLDPTPAPEPSSIVLLGLGAVGLVGAARRRRNSA